MAEEPQEKQKEKAKYATVEELKSLTSSIESLVNIVENLAGKINTPTATPETIEKEKEIRKAGPDKTPVNPEWEEKAREIIGEALERCEVRYIKSGGLLFTAVIKEEFSNAPKDYLKMYKEDRRSKEVGAEGLEGVVNWCKLIKQNLGKPRTITSV